MRFATLSSCSVFLSTPSARRATSLQTAAGCQTDDISIHALREEGDEGLSSSLSLFFYFYPRPPRGGRRRMPRPPAADLRISIHALREEDDQSVPGSGRPPWNFYPRPPRGGRLGVARVGVELGEISIHALREEGDPRNSVTVLQSARFLSTPSARRATSLVV